MKFFRKIGLFTLMTALMMLSSQSLYARGYFRSQYPSRSVYPQRPYYPDYTNNYYRSPHRQRNGIFTETPRAWPVRGANDDLYRYDNIYGAEASAAGRLGHHVVNPAPPFYFY